MLRRKLSAGLLRATNPSPSSVTPLCPPSPARPRSRSLASAVLLSSQRNWKSETVVTLKSELKKRGLSQQGNKSTLISRLESAETSSILPPLPPFPNNARTLSTTATRSQPPKATKDSTTAPGPATSVSADASESVTSTGPQVSSQRTEALKPEPVAPEQITVAPGLPESKVAATQSGAALETTSFPSVKVEDEIEQIIPLTPDNFSSNAALASSSAPALPEGPAKVLTVASASTHLSGGPVHASHTSTDSHSLEVADAAPDLSSIPSLASLAGSVFSAPSSAWKATGLKLPEVGLPKGGDGKGSEYKYDGKGLNEEEKRGAWVLAGVVGLGLFLGGGSRKTGSGKKSASSHSVEGLVEEGKKLVKGDAAWEKASGAGVVGHGSRKD
ncbi:hypothetical protein CI109_102969 [Kwoniella shandongensis]|uniref:SAP domain-containing protein n=1 Tax=Kwoniella shandongensis TaxID=1734106 RepID=A0AAJ8LJR3_9TREE